MPAQAQLVYEAGSLEIDTGRRELRARGVPVPIGGRAFEIVEALAQSAGELVTKDELIARVWPGAIVEESTLQVHISAIRDPRSARRLVQIVPCLRRLLAEAIACWAAGRPDGRISQRIPSVTRSRGRPPDRFRVIARPRRGVGPDRPDRCRAATSKSSDVRLSDRHADRAGWNWQNETGAGDRPCIGARFRW